MITGFPPNEPCRTRSDIDPLSANLRRFALVFQQPPSFDEVYSLFFIQ